MNVSVHWLAIEVRTIDTISQLLQRYVAWCISTSGVEQNFALRSWLITPVRASMKPTTEQDLMTIAAHDEPANVEEVHKKAVSIWKVLYKAPHKRHAKLTRTPTGFLKGCKKGSFKGWIQQRRDLVDNFAKSVVRMPIKDVERQAARLAVPRLVSV